MASQLDKLTLVPIWQLALGWLGVGVVMGGLWHLLYFSEALDSRDKEESVLAKAIAEREEMEKKLLGFEAEMEKAAAAQREIDESMEILPLSSASVDHLMRTFQQQGRLVGLVFEKWTPKKEVMSKHYAQTAVSVEATGTWNQLGEFYRRIAEMKKIVSIQDVQIGAGKSGASKDVQDASPLLSIKFEASTFRFLSDEERAGSSVTVKRSRR